MTRSLPVLHELCTPPHPSIGRRAKMAIKAHLHNIDSSCYWCGRYVVGKSSTLDHITPRSRGGGDEPGNLVLCCGTCNSVKSDRTPDEWLALLELMAARVRCYVFAESGSTG
jgi:5-methylcytosine-specific restriction endonuclease McrA